MEFKLAHGMMVVKDCVSVLGSFVDIEVTSNDDKEAKKIVLYAVSAEEIIRLAKALS